MPTRPPYAFGRIYTHEISGSESDHHSHLQDSRVTHWTLVRSSLVSADKMVIRYSLPLSNSTNKIQQEKLGGEKV